MRKMRTQVGSPAGYNGRAKGLPEVQESVLEHAAPNARQEEIAENSSVVNLVTRVADVRKTDVPQGGLFREFIRTHFLVGLH
jgi:hypothetical protein